MSEKSSSTSSISITGVLFLIFLTLKLLSVEPVAQWSWWWVVSPLALGVVLSTLSFVLRVFAATRSRK